MTNPKTKKFYSISTTPMEKRWDNAKHYAYSGMGLSGYVTLYSGIKCSLDEKYLPIYANGSKLNMWLLDLQLDAC